MKTEEQGLADPEMKFLLESAQGEIKRLGALLKDFRALAQSQSYDFEPTDLRKLIDETFAEDTLRYELAGVRLKFDFPDAGLLIAAFEFAPFSGNVRDAGVAVDSLRAGFCERNIQSGGHEQDENRDHEKFQCHEFHHWSHLTRPA